MIEIVWLLPVGPVLLGEQFSGWLVHKSCLVPLSPYLQHQNYRRRRRDLNLLMEEVVHKLDHQEQGQEHLPQGPSHHLQGFRPWEVEQQEEEQEHVAPEQFPVPRCRRIMMRALCIVMIFD